MPNSEQPEDKDKETRPPSLAARGERRRIERRLQEAGILCQPEVSLQYQTLAKRSVLRGVESHQVEAGRTSREIPPSMRRALVARDGGCRFPGCDRPPAWTDGHHLKHWADGNPTLPHNLALLCRRHHYRVHEEGWQLSWGDEGRLVAVPP